MKFFQKNNAFLRHFFRCVVFPVCLLTAAALANSPNAEGVVYEDANLNQKFDPGEKGIPGVLVSNQREVKKTGENGRYILPLEEGSVIFIVKPAGYAVPLNENNLPQFYYLHYPNGSPSFQYPGVPPGGELPQSINFPLYRVSESDTFSALVFADPQPRNDAEIDYIRDDVIAELIGFDAAFGITLGDIMYNDLSLFERYNRVVGQIGIPFYNVPGNHDLNFDAADDRTSLETFKRMYGPPYYALEYGKVSFIALDDVEWLGSDSSKGTGNYRGNLGEKQLTWLKNYLRFVPPERLIVIGVHIPVYYPRNSNDNINVGDRDQLFDILKDRQHLLIFTGHMHMVEHHFFEAEDGWAGKMPLPQVICSAVSGSWWSGPKDERGIPSSDQRDGAPNGYHIFRFAGNRYSQRFKAARFEEAYQIRISAPAGTLYRDEISDSTSIIANVFNGDETFKVTCQIDDLPPAPMVRSEIADPFMISLHQTHPETYPTWVNPLKSTHIWTAPLPQNLGKGIHKIVVYARDKEERFYQSARIFEIE
jgi:hypothetical protein